MEKESTFFGPIAESDFIASMTIDEFKRDTNVLEVLIKELLQRIPNRFEEEIARADFYIAQVFRQYTSNHLSRLTKFKGIRYVSKLSTNFETDQGYLNPNPLMLGRTCNKTAIKKALKRIKLEPNSITYEDFLTYSNIKILLRQEIFCRNGNIARKIYDEMIRVNKFPLDLKFRSEFIYWNVIPESYQQYFNKDMRPKTEDNTNCQTEKTENPFVPNNTDVNDLITEISQDSTNKRNRLESKRKAYLKKPRYATKLTSTADDMNKEQYSLSSNFEVNVVVPLSTESVNDDDVQIVENFEEPSVKPLPVISDEIGKLRNELINCCTLDQTLEFQPKSLEDLGIFEKSQSLVEIQNMDLNDSDEFNNFASAKPKIDLNNVLCPASANNKRDLETDCQSENIYTAHPTILYQIQKAKIYIHLF